MLRPWVGTSEETDGRGDEARHAAMQMRASDYVKAGERASGGDCTTGMSTRRLGGRTPRESVMQKLRVLSLLLWYALEPLWASSQCPSANHVSRPALVYAVHAASTSGADLAVSRSAINRSIHHFSAAFVILFCPALPPASFSSRLVHRNSSKAAIFGWHIVNNPQRALHALQRSSPRPTRSVPQHNPGMRICQTVFVLPASYIYLVSLTAVAGKRDCIPAAPRESCCCP